MTRVVKRRYKVQPPKRPDAGRGLCGWCIGWGRVPHHECSGMKTDTFTCTCRVCYGLPTTMKKETPSATP